MLQEKLPVFVKPVEEKLAPGIVVNSWKDLSEYEWLDVKTELYCSKVVHFVSEWRCFLLYGQIIGIQFYYQTFIMDVFYCIPAVSRRPFCIYEQELLRRITHCVYAECVINWIHNVYQGC